MNGSGRLPACIGRTRPLGALAVVVGLLLAGCIVSSSKKTTESVPFEFYSSTPKDGASKVSVGTTRLEVEFSTPLATNFSAIRTAVAGQVALDDITNPATERTVTYNLGYGAITETLRFDLGEPLLWAHTYRIKLLAQLTTEDGEHLGQDMTVTFQTEPMDLSGGVYANRVVAYAPVPAAAKDSGFYHGDAALGPPRGNAHSTALGYDRSAAAPTPGGSITLGFADANGPQCIVDGTGADFTVVTRVAKGQSGNTTDAAYVEVSQDNVTYYRFPPTFPALGDPKLIALVGDPANYKNMAGIVVGGDPFDLADIIDQPGGPASPFQACYVRIVDGGTEVPDFYSNPPPFVDASIKSNSSGVDIDAVTVEHSAAPNSVLTQ